MTHGGRLAGSASSSFPGSCWASHSRRPARPRGSRPRRRTRPWEARACAQVDRGFRPTSLAIDGVVGSTKVLALGQDQHGVPRPPPLTERGKWQFAWDKAAGVRPGGPEGVVRLTAHTYPRDGSHGSALGNLLLARLRTGAQLEVSGAGGERLCYRVTRRVEVSANASLSGYYATTGPPRLAILVCSGKRRGPGDWSHRTSGTPNRRPQPPTTHENRRSTGDDARRRVTMLADSGVLGSSTHVLRWPLARNLEGRSAWRRSPRAGSRFARSSLAGVT